MSFEIEPVSLRASTVGPVLRSRDSHWNALRGLSLTGILALCLLNTGCVERVVQSTLLIHAAPEGRWAVIASRELRGDDLPEDYVARRRADDIRRELESGRDPLLSVLDPTAAEAGYELLSSRNGRAVRAERGVLLDDLGLELLLSSWGLGVSIERHEGRVELSIVPGRPSRASRSEVDRFEAELRPFLDALAEHFENTAAVYGYAEEHPDRSAAVLADLFDLDHEIELTETEDELLARAKDALERVLGVLMLSPEQDQSLQELSSRILDPLPARTMMTSASELIASEGLERKGQILEAPETTLWSAVESFEGRWLRPDPATLFARQMRAEAEGESFEIGLDDLGAPWRSPDLPNRIELEDALREAFEAAPVLRASWVEPGEDLAGPEATLESAAALLGR